MTTVTAFSEDWASHPLGKTLRVLIAVGGVVTAFLVMMLATLGTDAVWLLVLTGVAVAATAIRAAISPTTLRLLTVLAAIVALPILGLII